VPEEDGFRVAHDASRSRYELRLGDELVGFITYEPQTDAVALIHTEVDPSVQGRGLGTRLVSGALDDIRARGLSVVPICPFVVSYLRRHPEYADLAAREPARGS
jgi:predicted GNAT family acetyltransferase